jgi:tricarballylate dehydrogenase
MQQAVDASPDVIVLGSGNAAMCAAIAARDNGARVLVVEKAPQHFRGGNSYFTAGAFRFAYNGLDDIRRLIPDLSDEEARNIDVGRYDQPTFYGDMMRVTEGLSDPALADTLVSRSFATMDWLREHGMRWVLMFGRQAFKVGDITRFWGGLIVEAIGAGKGLSDREFEIAEEMGIQVAYETKGVRLIMNQRGAVEGLTVQTADGFHDLRAGAVVLACGGFEANPEMRTRYLGQGWELAKVRGTRHNTGDGIRMALEVGAQPFGHWSGAHAVAWDLNAPPFGDRTIADLFQKHSYPFGLIVNIEGHRFVDEGADFRNYTYARYGREVLRQPERAAFQLFDQKVLNLLRDEYNIPQVTKAESATIGGLADQLGIDASELERTVASYNAAVQPGDFNPTLLDGKHTEGIAPPKSNWAQTLDSPPYVGYAVTCGITFSFGGLRITPDSGQVLDTEDRPIAGLYAAGELVGGLFYYNYAGGSGLMAGSVFGRIAGAAAAEASKRGAIVA